MKKIDTSPFRNAGRAVPEPVDLKSDPNLVLGILIGMGIVLFAMWWTHYPMLPRKLLEFYRRDAGYLMPAWGGFFATWFDNLKAIVLLGLFEIACLGIGERARAWLANRKPGGLWGFLFSLGMGNGIVGVAVLGLGLSGLFSRPLFVLVLLISLVPGSRLIRSSIAAGSGGRMAARVSEELKSMPWWAWPPLAFCVFILLGNLLPALEPEWFYDSLVYHLASPESYLIEGKICSPGQNVSSNLPFLIEMQYTVLLALGGDVPCRLLCWMTGTGCALAVVALARPLVGSAGAVLAACVFLSQPTLRFLHHVTMVELGLTFFEMLAIMSFVKGAGWAGSRCGLSRRGWVILCGCFLGFAHGTKYMAVFCSALLIAWLTIGALARGRKRAAGEIAVLIGAASLLTLPWLAKSWLMTGNPVFPFLQDLMPAYFWDSELHGIMMASNTRHGVARSGELLKWLAVPANASVESSMFGTFSLNPFILIYLPLMLFFRRLPSLVKFAGRYGLAFFVIWVFTSQQARLLFPVAPLASVAVVFLAGRLATLGSAFRVAQAGIAAWILLVATHAQTHNRLVDTGLVPFTLGHIDRDKLLRDFVPYYDTARRAGEVMGERDRLLLLGEGESFHCPRRRLRNSFFDVPRIGEMTRRAGSAGDLVRSLRKLKVTHIMASIVRPDAHIGYALFDPAEERKDRFGGDAKVRARFLEFWATRLKLVHSARHVYLFEILDRPRAVPKAGLPTFFYVRSAVHRARNLGMQVERMIAIGRGTEAEKLSAEVVKLMPRSAFAHSYRAYVLTVLRRSGEAKAEYREAIRLGYPQAEVYYNLGMLLEGEGKSERALAHILKGIERNPQVGSKPGVGLRKAFELAIRLKRVRSAIEVGEKILKLNPDDAKMRWQLKGLRARQGAAQ